jgi:hypothetical protein
VPRYNADRSASRPTDRHRRWQTAKPLRPELVSGRELCYVIIKPCGCAVEAVIPGFCSNRDIGHRVGPALRKGWALERMHLDDARDALTKCPHDQPHAGQADFFARTRA